MEGLLSGVGQAGVAAVEGVFDALAEYSLSYFDDEVVDQHVAEKVRREGRRVLLQVLRFQLARAMFGRAQFQLDHGVQAQVGSSNGQRLKEGKFSPVSLSRASYHD